MEVMAEHRLKLFRIIGQLRRGTLYTETGLHERLLEFAATQRLEDVCNKLQQDVILDEQVAGDREGEIVTTNPEELAQRIAICNSFKNLISDRKQQLLFLIDLVLSGMLIIFM